MTCLVNIIGAGHLGQTIGYLLNQTSAFKLGGIYTRSEVSGLDAINFMGGGFYCADILSLPAADVTFITTPDNAIRSACERLSSNPQLKLNSLVLHGSGALTSDELNAVKELGCHIASVHPMQSFARPDLSIQQYAGTYCAVEGEPEGILRAREIFDAIGSICYEIDKQHKSAYHAAGVFASNYVVTLSQQALACMQQAGVDDKLAMQVITGLMRGTLSNLEQTLSPREALTGPIKRGDYETVNQHLNAIHEKKLYAMLGNATLPLTTLSEEKKIIFNHLLTESMSEI